MRKHRGLAMAALLVVGIALPAVARSDGIAWARLGQTVYVDGPRVTPVRVLEDSRCPRDVQCAWPGQVRLQVRIHTGRGNALREISSITPIRVADGQLTLASVLPVRPRRPDLLPRDYRFGFRFSGGL